MTIRAKLYVAILLTVLGPVVTIAVALHGMQRLGDRFDEVQQRADHGGLAHDLKFDVTDFNGWQTAYGYDDGASRPRFERSVRQFRADFNAARNELTDPREVRILDEIGLRFDVFMRLDAEAYAALKREGLSVLLSEQPARAQEARHTDERVFPAIPAHRIEDSGQRARVVHRLALSGELRHRVGRLVGE